MELLFMTWIWKQWLNSPLLDVVDGRHNAAHRSAQKQVFNQLDFQDPQRPGIVTFSLLAPMQVLWGAP